MKEQIYQNGFYLLLGLFIGLLINFKSISKTDVIKIELKQDSINKPVIKKVNKELSKDNLKQELIEQNIPYPNIVLAQAKLESGLGTSSIYKQTNNLFGLRKNSKYCSYSHWTASVEDYKKCISNKYKGGSYYKFLEELPYAEDPQYLDKLKQIAKQI